MLTLFDSFSTYLCELSFEADLMVEQAFIVILRDYGFGFTVVN